MHSSGAYISYIGNYFTVPSYPALFKKPNSSYLNRGMRWCVCLITNCHDKTINHDIFFCNCTQHLCWETFGETLKLYWIHSASCIFGFNRLVRVFFWSDCYLSRIKFNLQNEYKVTKYLFHYIQQQESCPLHFRHDTFWDDLDVCI